METVRIAIIGNSGSGKSTLARSLAAAHRLPVLDLDTVAWEPGEVAVARDPLAAADEVHRFCESNGQWIVEGCYGGLVDVALRHSPILVFLEPGVEACVANCRQRPWEAHKYDSRQEQDAHLEFLLAWVREYYTREGDLSLVGHQALFDRYGGTKQKLADRPDVDFLSRLSGTEG